MSYRLGEMSDIDPKTGESYDVLEKTRRVETKAKKETGMPVRLRQLEPCRDCQK